MRTRWLAALAGATLAAAPAAAQPPRPISVFDTTPARSCTDCDDRPAQLPPLLAVPQPAAPRPAGPRGPAGEYDPGYFYLPERAPVSERPDPPCGPPGRFWVAPSLELGNSKAAHVPVLVRLGSPVGPVVFGNEQLRTPVRAGLGLAGGVWLDERHTRGFDASLYSLSEGGSDAAVLANTVPLVLPTANGTGFPIADPATGRVGEYLASLSTRFTSADVNYRQNLLCGDGMRLDGLVGYRFAHLADDFNLAGRRDGPRGVVSFADAATARNNFHGGQLGLAGEYRLDRWYVAGTGKVAFGVVYADTDLHGRLRAGGAVVPAGFYARPGLAGEMQHSRFGVMPTTGVTFGRQLGDHSRVYVGYNLLYLTGVTRGPDVLDPLPNVLARNPLAPLPALNAQRDAATSDFWVQSLSFGMEWRY